MCGMQRGKVFWKTHLSKQGFANTGAKASQNFEEGVPEKMISEESVEEGEGINHEVEGYLGNLAPGRGESQCKGPEVGQGQDV